MTMPYVLIVSC